MTLKSHIRRLRGNKRGGIEGLPLQLMIIILVAALGTAIIIGWMNSIDTPKSIRSVEAEPVSINGTNGVDITINVTDQDGNPLPGAVFHIGKYALINFIVFLVFVPPGKCIIAESHMNRNIAVCQE